MIRFQFDRSTPQKANTFFFLQKPVRFSYTATIPQQEVTLSDHKLLKDHLRDPTGPSLGILIDRNLPLVHSVARRITANDEAARDISQTVFLRLLKKASKIPLTLPLTAWFHRETHSASVDHVRAEVRRQNREQTAASLNAMKDSPEFWEQISPEIDDAINELSEENRALVLLRFYQNKTHPEIASELGISEDASRMRTNRALKKLRSLLSKRGITTTATILASTLPINAVSPAPPALAVSITGVVQSATVTTTATTSPFAFLKAHSLTLGALALGTTFVVTQQVKINQLQSALNFDSASQRTITTLSPPPSSATTSRSSRTTHSGQPDLLSIFANPDPTERLQLLQKFGVDLSVTDIPQTLDLLRQKTPEWDRESKMLTHLLLTRWAKADPEAAFTSLDQANFTLERGHATSILSALTALNPRRAAEWLTKPSNKQAYYPTLGHILAGTIAKEWARQDTPAALAWAQNLPDQQQSGAYSGIFGTIASTDPERAATLALTLDQGAARDHILPEIAATWARQSPREALAWASSLDADAHEKSSATKAALYSWAVTDPEKTAAFLDQNNTTDHLELIAEQWARHNPADAASWVVSKPQSPQQNKALGKVLWNWTNQNPTAATSWIESQPAGVQRDHAIAGLTVAAGSVDPEVALTWTQKITDSKLRETMTHHTLSAWSQSSPEAAQTWREAHQKQASE